MTTHKPEAAKAAEAASGTSAAPATGATGAAAGATGTAAGATPDFTPKIVAFCCYYCAYSAADLAGSLRLQYPPTIRVIEVPCSGKVDPVILLRAFEEGADGVYVAGCMEGDCHFLKGNFRAKKRVQAVKKILDQIGLGGQRLEMFNLSAAMGTRFAEIATDMTKRIEELGPSPIRPEALAARKAAAGAGTGNAGVAAAVTGAGGAVAAAAAKEQGEVKTR